MPPRMNRILSILALTAILCIFASCRKEAEESSEYLELVGSNWGIGVTLGMDREEVVSVLGEPDYEVEARNKLSTDLIWTPEETTAHAIDDSQLRITLTDDSVTRMMCIRKLPEADDEVIYEPPYLLKAAAGCTIGSLKSDFADKLGPPSEERSDSLLWEHESLDGNRLRITAVFEMDEELGTSVCHSIAVQTGKPLGSSAAMEKKKEVEIY